MLCACPAPVVRVVLPSLPRINIEWTRESGRYAENRPRDDGSQPRIRVTDRNLRHRAAPLPPRALPTSTRSEYQTHTLDAAATAAYRRRGSRSRSPRRRGSLDGQAKAESPSRLDRARRASPKRITLRSVRRDRDGDRDKDRDRDRSDSRDRDRDAGRDTERERDRDRGEWKRRDSSIERDVRDARRDRDLRDGRDSRDGARSGGDRRYGSRERNRDERPAYREERDRGYDRDRAYERDRPVRDSVRRGSYDREVDRVRSRSPVRSRVNGSVEYRRNGRSRSRSARPLTPNRSPTPPRSLRRSRSRSRSLSPVHARNGSTSKLRRSISPSARHRSRS